MTFIPDNQGPHPDCDAACTCAAEGQRLKAKIHDLKAQVSRLHTQLDALLAHCPDPECYTCGQIICPLGDPMHFHHDGCPACSELEHARD